MANKQNHGKAKTKQNKNQTITTTKNKHKYLPPPMKNKNKTSSFMETYYWKAFRTSYSIFQESHWLVELAHNVSSTCVHRMLQPLSLGAFFQAETENLDCFSFCSSYP